MRSRVVRLAPMLVVAGAWSVAWLWSWLFGGGDEAENILWTLTAVVSAISALVAARRPENRASAASFRLFAVGALMWALGQLTWTVYAMRGVELPYPSLADVGYLAALPLFAAGIVMWPRARHRRFAPGELLEIVLGVAAVALVVNEFAIAPLIKDGVHGLTGALDLIYPISEFGLAAAVIVGLLFGGWRDRGRLVVIMSGLLVLAVGDTVFVHFDGVVGQAIDPTWTIPFFALGIAAALPPSRSTAKRPSSVRLVFLVATFVVLRAVHLTEALEGEALIEWVEDLGLSVLLLAILARALALGRTERQERERTERLKAEVDRAYADRDAALEASRTGLALIAGGQPRFWNRAFLELLNVESTGHGLGWTAVRERLDRMTGQEISFWRDERYLRVRSTDMPAGGRLVTVDDFTAEETEREDRDRFVAEIMRAREEEARMIAEQLHDDALQELSALALRLELDAMRTGNERLVDFARDTNAISRSIRKLVVMLHPAVLESRGLSPAIDAAAQSLREAGLHVDVEDLPLRFEPELERLAYRLVQEAFMNVLKHAAAERVDVRLRLRNGFLELDVSDDGRGFDHDTAFNQGPLGLHLARERLELAGGKLRIRSAKSGGTSFAFDLPVSLRARALEASA